MRNAILTGLVALVAASFAMAATSNLPADPSFSPAVIALFDRPSHQAKQQVSGRSEPGVVRCNDYTTFRVKELDYGEHGDDAISVTSEASPDPSRCPACGKQDDPGEVVLKTGTGSYFVGAKGEFIYVFSTLTGDDGGAFWVHSGQTGEILYTDTAIGGDEPKALKVEGGKLTLKYERGLAGGCSILTGGQACWDSIVKRNHLPASIAKLPPPVAACRTGYAREHGDPKSGNIFAYDVTVEIERGSKAVVTDRGALTCFPPG